MKFKNYINENNIEDYVETIKKDCKPFLKDWESKYLTNFLWSGRNETKPFLKKHVRKDRKPRDTPLDIHYFIDHWFYKKFGIRFRSNSVFCYFNINGIEQYGKPFMLFPIGKYEICSSKKIFDLYSDILYEIPKSKWNNFNVDEKKEYLETVEESLEEADYKVGQYTSTTEIMVHCKEYYLLSGKLKLTKDMFK